MTRYNNYTDSLFYKIAQTAKYCRHLALQVFSNAGIEISIDEFAVMDVLRTHCGICQRDLAKIILKDRANTGRIVNSLEERGFILRFNDKKNNRDVKKLELTSLGKEYIEKTSEILKQYLSGIKSPLTEKAEIALEESLLKFRSCLEQEVEMKI